MRTIIAALDPNRVIGLDNDLPWNLPEDLQHFKRTTLDHPIVMGRKTYDSLPRRPLPRRTNIVVSREHTAIEGADVFGNLDDALAFGESLSEEVFVIGGSAIYEQAVDIVDRMLLTHVTDCFPGNRFFPVIDRTIWREAGILSRTEEFTIVDYRRSPLVD